MDGKTQTLWVLGNPIAHSKSPLMHNGLFKALNINAAYLPFAPNPDDLSLAIKAFRVLKFRGGNITIPFKTNVIDYLDKLSPISSFTHSVNTLYWENGIIGETLCGTSTDPYGCIKNLEEHGIKAQQKKIALLGSGGAAKAIAFALMENQNELSIICRHKEKGLEIAENLNQIFHNNVIQVLSFEEFPQHSEKFQIIINATSVGMHPNENESPLEENSLFENQIICDIVYNPKETKLLKLAKQKGCKTVSGEGMLIYQGLESFKIWFPQETVKYSDEFLAKIMKENMEVSQ